MKGDAARHLRTLIDRFDPDVFDSPTGKARIRLALDDETSWDVVIDRRRARLNTSEGRADALLTADEKTWQRIADDLPAGMDAYTRGLLKIRHNLHLGVAFLAATSGMHDDGRLEFPRVKTRRCHISYLEAGTGDPVVCIHGLGGTKGSFLPTVAALADEYRVIALDLPGFGDSDKPIAVPYNASYFADATTALMDELGIDQAHVIGNSMGGRVALELGFEHSDRTKKLALLAPSLAWL